MSKSIAPLCQLILIMGLAMSASACSTIEDLDPTGLIGGSTDSTPDSQFPDTADAAPTASNDAAAGTTPDLASLPARPAPATTADQQAQATQSLANDGAQARYSADALRGGTETAAPPPTASEGTATIAQRVLGADAPPTASDAPPTAGSVQTAAIPPAAGSDQMAAIPPTATPTASLPTGAQSATAPAAPNVQTAALAPAAAPASRPAPSGEPAVPANTPVRGAMTNQPVSDMALGFRPSSAPPLDPSVSQFVSAPIVAHYRQTASNAGISGVSAAAVPAVPPKAGAKNSARGMGGPDMSGAVVANLDAISGAPGSIAAMNGGVAPTAVVYFPGDGTSLSTAARAQVRSAVAAFKADGGQGVVRVVGHASSRTGNMPVEKHLETIFEKSQARANAVAQELIHEGVPATKVMIDAVGDSQPVYYESMPQGEEGNRRAEIFVQG